MHDPRLAKLADVLVNYSAKVKKGDLVTIVGDPAAMFAVEALFEAIYKAGGHPSFHPKSEAMQELLLTHGSVEQLQHVSPFEEHRLAHCDVLMVLIYPTNTKYLSRVDPAKAAMAQAARREIIAMSIKRGAEGTLRYALTEIPSHAAAQDAQMSLRQYEDFVYKAGFLHLPDPVAAWRNLHEQQQRVCDYLMQKKVLKFVVPGSDGREGTDLTVEVSGRKWINCAGADNFPDGEVYTGPVSAEGVVNFNFPAVYKGMECDGVRLKFAGGRVVEASATKNEDYLIKLLDQDAGARVMGEIAIGTNYSITEFMKNTMFDEKIGGTFHAAVGAGFPETGCMNESGLHWDMVCSLRQGGTIHADGELIQRDGVFLRQGWPGN